MNPISRVSRKTRAVQAKRYHVGLNSKPMVGRSFRNANQPTVIGLHVALR